MFSVSDLLLCLVLLLVCALGVVGFYLEVAKKYFVVL